MTTKKQKTGAPKGNENSKTHGLAGMREKYYKANIEQLVDSGKLPQEMQSLVNDHMAVYKKQDNFNNVTAPLYKRLAFKMAWCDLAEQWFFSNAFGPFSISKNGELIGSHLAMQYKIFSETASRDMEKLQLIKARRRIAFQGFDFGSAMQEINEEQNDSKE